VSVDRKAAIVTGSATGIGRAVALQLAEAGYSVTVNYRDSDEEARDTASAITAIGGDCIVVRADVAADADCRSLVRETVDKWGRIDVLVNNAGYTRAVAIGDLGSVTDDDWDRTFATNLRGAFFMARACERFLRGSRGAIVNVSSVAGLTGFGSSIPYAASKAALNNLTLALARVLAPEVRVNAVLPGYVETRWNERSLGNRLSAMRKLVKTQTPLGDVARPAQVAQAVVSMIRGMEWVTGELVVVDGGLLARG
jgi:3-oxoacyl-[acyl-carrier protein] reductase